MILYCELSLIPLRSTFSVSFMIPSLTASLLLLSFLRNSSSSTLRPPSPDTEPHICGICHEHIIGSDQSLDNVGHHPQTLKANSATCVHEQDLHGECITLWFKKSPRAPQCSICTKDWSRSALRQPFAEKALTLQRRNKEAEEVFNFTLYDLSRDSSPVDFSALISINRMHKDVLITLYVLCMLARQIIADQSGARFTVEQENHLF